MEIRGAGAVIGTPAAVVPSKEPSLWQRLQTTIANVAEAVTGKVAAVKETIAEKVGGATDAVITVAEKVAGSVKETTVKAVTAVKATGTAVVGGIKSTVNWVKYAVPVAAVGVGLLALARLKG